MSTRRNTPNTEPQKLAAELQNIGFSDYEARSYLALLQLSAPSTAYEISKIAGIPRANSYSVLEILTDKRAVQPVSQSPLRYVPIEPDILLGRIAEETTAQCEQLKTKLSRLRTIGTGNEPVWTLTGEFEVEARIREMIDGAQEHIWIKAHETRLLPHETALRNAAERGTQIVLILFGTDVERFTYGGESRTYLHEGNGIPVGVAHHLITLTRDFTEALMVNMDESAYGAYTRSRPVVNMAVSLLRHEIYIAELFHQLGKEIEAIFGPALRELRRQYLPREQYDRLEDLLGEMDLDSREKRARSSAVAETPSKSKQRQGKGSS